MNPQPEFWAHYFHGKENPKNDLSCLCSTLLLSEFYCLRVSSLHSEELKSVTKGKYNGLLLGQVHSGFIVIRLEFLAIGERVEDVGKHHPCNCNNGFLALLATAFTAPFAFYSGKCALNQ